MIGFDERKQIILHLYKLIKESKMFQDYNDEDIKEAAIKSEQKAYDTAKSKEEYILFMKAKFEKVTKNNTHINMQNINNRNNNIDNYTMTHNNIFNHSNIDQKNLVTNNKGNFNLRPNENFIYGIENNALSNNGFYNNGNIINNNFSNLRNANNYYNRKNYENNNHVKNDNIINNNSNRNNNGVIPNNFSNISKNTNSIDDIYQNNSAFAHEPKNFVHSSVAYLPNHYDATNKFDQNKFNDVNNMRYNNLNQNKNDNYYRERFVNKNPKTNFTTYHRQGHANNYPYFSQINNSNNNNLHPENLQMKNYIKNNDIEKNSYQKRPINQNSPKATISYGNFPPNFSNNKNFNGNNINSQSLNPNMPYSNNNGCFMNKKSSEINSPHTYNEFSIRNSSNKYFQLINENKKINYSLFPQNDIYKYNQNIKSSDLSNMNRFQQNNRQLFKQNVKTCDLSNNSYRSNDFSNIKNIYSPTINNSIGTYNSPSFYTPQPTHNSTVFSKRSSLQNDVNKTNSTKSQEENVNELFHSISDIFKKEDLNEETDFYQKHAKFIKTEKKISNNKDKNTKLLENNVDPKNKSDFVCNLAEERMSANEKSAFCENFISNNCMKFENQNRAENEYAVNENQNRAENEYAVNENQNAILKDNFNFKKEQFQSNNDANLNRTLKNNTPINQSLNFKLNDVNFGEIHTSSIKTLNQTINKNLMNDTTNNIENNITKTKESILKKTRDLYETYKYKNNSKSYIFMNLYKKLETTNDLNETKKLSDKLLNLYNEVLNETKLGENKIDYEEIIENIIGVFKSKKNVDENYVLDLVDK